MQSALFVLQLETAIVETLFVRVILSSLSSPPLSLIVLFNCMCKFRRYVFLDDEQRQEP